MTTTQLLEPLVESKQEVFKNRLAMSAMTRSFADIDHKCTSEISDYYERRASGGVGLIITEGIVVHPSGDGYNSVPHLHTESQMESWVSAVNAVHKHNTKIFAQLWHCGRISHPDFTRPFEVISSTDKTAEGLNRQNNKPYGKPKRLSLECINDVYSMFVNSSELAIKAGFDGVEIHMGHGYLVDQFFDSRINDRTDEYGGSIENRCRFAIELCDKVIKTIGANRVMIRISPSRIMNGLYEWPDMYEMLDFLLPELLNLGLKKLDISCANANYYETSGKVIRKIRCIWPHLLIGGASLSPEQAAQEIANGYLDVVTWGRAILANPDFGKLIETDQPLVKFEDSMRKILY